MDGIDLHGIILGIYMVLYGIILGIIWYYITNRSSNTYLWYYID